VVEDEEIEVVVVHPEHGPGSVDDAETSEPFGHG
jgi:hypothetical protein